MSRKYILIGSVVLVLGLGGAALYFFYLFKTKDLSSYIPKNALFVAKPNMLSLYKKMNFKELSDFKFYKYLLGEIGSDTKDDIDKYTEEPKGSGLSFTQTPILFSFNNSKDEFAPIGALVFGISDKENFTKFFKNLTEDKFDIKNGELFTTVEINSQLHLIFNDNVGFILSGTEDDVNYKKIAEKLIDLKKEESILSNESYINFQKNAYDLNLFINKDALKKGLELAVNNLAEFENIEKSINASPIGMTLSFEDDLISVKSYADPKYKESDDLFKSKGMSSNASSFLAPNGRPLGFISTNLNLLKLFEAISAVDEYNSALDYFADEIGLNSKKLFEIMSGEMSFSIIDMVEMPVNNDFSYDDDPLPSTEIIPAFLFRAKISNKNDFKIFMDKLTPEMVSEDGYYKIPYDSHNERWLYVLNKNDELYITNYKDYISDLNSNKNWFQLKDETVSKQFNSNPLTLYMDLKYDSYKKIIEDPGNNTLTKLDKKILKVVTKNLKSVYGSYSNGSITLELKMTEKNMNSLWRIFVVVEDLYKEMIN